MTLEDIAFNSIVDFLQINQNFDLLSAHPPSGKSYFTDLIRIPLPDQNGTAARRAHIDIIFCSDRFLYLCEVKGVADESDADIEKLRNLKEHYTLSRLKRLISDRLSLPSSRLESAREPVLTIGCTKASTELAEGFLYLVAKAGETPILLGAVTDEILIDFSLAKTQ